MALAWEQAAENSSVSDHAWPLCAGLMTQALLLETHLLWFWTCPPTALFLAILLKTGSRGFLIAPVQ